MTRTLVVLAAAVALTLTLVSGAAASSRQTLQFVSRQQAFTLDPQNGPPTVGSRLFFEDAIYNKVAQFDKPVGARIGHTEGVCTIVTPHYAQCLITAHVPNGQIVVAGGMTLKQGPAHNHFAIIGGAGAYGSATGTVDSRDLSETRSIVTLNLGS
jgi:hypothetical protein